MHDNSHNTSPRAIPAVLICRNSQEKKGAHIWHNKAKTATSTQSTSHGKISKWKVVLVEPGHRRFDREILDICIREKLIYEFLPYHNCVFVGYDLDGIARYAAYRSIGKDRFIGEAAGSDKRYSFRIESPGDTIHVFESAIDLLSYATIVKMRGRNWLQDSLLSLGGVYVSGRNPDSIKLPIALAESLKRHPEVTKVALHLDNDYAGRIAAEAITLELSSDYQLLNAPPLTGKDCNDYLLTLRKS